jgi:antitoxin Phd
MRKQFDFDLATGFGGPLSTLGGHSRPIMRISYKMTSLMTSCKEIPMNIWPVQDAKARFSEFLDACLAEGPQMVTRRGAEAAVLVPAAEWKRLQSAARPSLKELLLSDAARSEFLVPARGAARRRQVKAMG